MASPPRLVNPLCNLYFTGISSALIIGLGLFITDRLVEPRLKGTAVDGDADEMPKMEELPSRESLGMWAGLFRGVLGVGLLWLLAAPQDSALRADGKLTSFAAPLMKMMIVRLIFLLFLIPGVVHGYVSGTVKNHRDIIKGMSKTMSTMGYYLVMAFFAALFIDAFKRSNVGQVAALEPDLRADADAVGHRAGTHAGGLPHRRFHDQHHHPADALFPAGGGGVQSSVISCQSSAVSHQSSVVSCQLSVVSCRAGSTRRSSFLI